MILFNAVTSMYVVLSALIELSPAASEAESHLPPSVPSFHLAGQGMIHAEMPFVCVETQTRRMYRKMMISREQLSGRWTSCRREQRPSKACRLGVVEIREGLF